MPRRSSSTERDRDAGTLRLPFGHDRRPAAAAQPTLGARLTDRIASALPDEPEAISAEEQARQTLAARSVREQQRQEAWREARSRIVDGVQIVRASRPPMPNRIISNVRVIERTLARIAARVGCGGENLAVASGDVLDPVGPADPRVHGSSHTETRGAGKVGAAARSRETEPGYAELLGRVA
jgi:hypothetical protein